MQKLYFSLVLLMVSAVFVDSFTFSQIHPAVLVLNLQNKMSQVVARVDIARSKVLASNVDNQRPQRLCTLRMSTTSRVRFDFSERM